MSFRAYALTFLMLASGPLLSDTSAPQNTAIQISEDFQLPGVPNDQQFNAYLSAYLQGILDNQFPENGTSVRVQEGQVILNNLPKDTTQKKIVALIQKIVSQNSPKEKTDDADVTGMWFPEATLLYPTMLADPLRVCFAGGIRLRDHVAGQVSTPVTFGDQFPLYRWNNVQVYKKKGDVQLGIEGAVFAIFNQTQYSSPLINADYYVALPLSFATKRWAHRLRIYHISSHLGDEYMNRKHHAKRVNKSFEAIDYFASYMITKDIRLYGGLGVVPHSDSEMHMKKLYAEYGLEVRAGRKEWKDLYGTPYLAMHFENWQDCDYKIDANFAIGYEWGKLNGLGRKFRVALEYHNGHCSEGQFSRSRSDYIQAMISWGF